MSAVILAFPGAQEAGRHVSTTRRQGDFLCARSPAQAVDVAGPRTDFLVTGHQLPAPFTTAWCAQHLPLIDAAMDLFEADDVEFARRCLLMRDEDGRAMLDELAGQLQRLGANVSDVADALGLTAARIRNATGHEVTNAP